MYPWLEMNDQCQPIKWLKNLKMQTLANPQDTNAYFYTFSTFFWIKMTLFLLSKATVPTTLFPLVVALLRLWAGVVIDLSQITDIWHNKKNIQSTAQV